MLMMMDCPRCGFNQPKDRYCANCGLNVEAALAQKPPLWTRIGSSPKLYAGLVGILAVFLLVFLFTSKMPRLFGNHGGAYISSREAADPDHEPSAEARTLPEAPPEPEPVDLPAAEPSVENPPEAAAKAAASTAPEPKRFEAEFWEISREQVAVLVDHSERVGEDQLGRAYLVHEAGKVRDVLRASARPVGAGFREDLKPSAQIVIETPPTATQGLHFVTAIQLSKWEDSRANLRFVSSLAMTPPETPEEIALGPTVRPVIETGLSGSFDLTAGEALVIWMTPTNRRPRAEFLAKAGAGPWQIFASPNFRVGETDWILTVRLR